MKKQKNTVSFVASLGAGVQSQSTAQLFKPVGDVEKQLSLLASITLQWWAMPVSKKKQVSEQRKQFKTFDDFSVRAYRFDLASGPGCLHGRCKQLVF